MSTATAPTVSDPLHREILGQPEAIEESLRNLVGGTALTAAGALFGPTLERIVVSGMGASYFSSYPFYLRLLDAGLPVVRLEAGELLHFATALATPSSLLVLVSQSGRTGELLQILQRLPLGTPVVAITNEPSSPLAQRATITLAFAAGEETAAATKTSVCSMLTLDLLAEELLRRAGRTALGIGTRIEVWQHTARALAQAIAEHERWFPPLARFLGLPEHVFFLGRGPSLAAVRVGALMTKEMAHVHAEAMSVPQFRHGPLESAGPGRSAIVAVTPGALRTLDLKLAEDMVALGMRVATITLEATTPVRTGIERVVLPSVPTGMEPILHMLPLQLLAREFALQQGMEPGQFLHTGKVTDHE